MHINVANLLHRSAANGPGDRFVIWVQGCPLGCEGCWNPDTWSFRRRTLKTVDELAATILVTNGIEGVTFSGGEPFIQARALSSLAKQVREAGLSVFVFTGYELGELTRRDHLSLLAQTDVLVSGRYIESQRKNGLLWRGSENQKVHYLTDRYRFSVEEQFPEVEFLIGPEGSLAATGFPHQWMSPRISDDIGEI